jgi:ribosomal protein S18 acetylase RimI-like enzyme
LPRGTPSKRATSSSFSTDPVRSLARRGRLKARMLSHRDRSAALDYLSLEPRDNLLLIDMVQSVGGGVSLNEIPPQVIGAWRHGVFEGAASLRPSMVLDTRMREDVREIFLPFLEAIETGLLKSADAVATPLWQQLSGRGRRALIDRRETAYALDPADEVAQPRVPGAIFRRAHEGDLEALVLVARASLREEQRPDPFDGDPTGFRRWVRGRMPRARVVELDSRVVFAGYADVRRPEGWLVQGVYTTPDARRQGCAALGMSGIIREAFSAGADHVQLAVVEGNAPAIALYERLGFRPFSQLRTVLFF